MTGEEEFEHRVVAVVTRYFAQSSRPAPDAQIVRFARQLHALMAERGLPRPLGENEIGVPGGMSDSECAPLVARVTEGTDDSGLTEVARQLVKACFYPEFKVCRDSFRAVGSDGTCRRQELERARGRISGCHCVDCPHWIAIGRGPHLEFLVREWRKDARQLMDSTDIFLPEDFRGLRRWLHAAARRGSRSTH